jgi:hypothetical protein
MILTMAAFCAGSFGRIIYKVGTVRFRRLISEAKLREEAPSGSLPVEGALRRTTKRAKRAQEALDKAALVKRQ